MTLDRRDHPGNRPAQCLAEPRLISHFNRPNNRTTTPGKRNPAPTRRDNRAVNLPQPRRIRTSQTQSPRQHTDEDS